MNLKYCPFLVKTKQPRKWCLCTPTGQWSCTPSHHDVFLCADHRSDFKSSALFWVMVHFQSCLCGHASLICPVNSFRGHKPFWRENLILARGQTTSRPLPCWFDELASQKVMYMVDSLKLVYLGKCCTREIESLLSMTLSWNRAREIRRVHVAR